MLSPDHPNFFEIVVTRPNRHSGFTLIEIVMVLVLSGILTAVAVPKYFDLQEEARMKAASAAIAEAQSRINATFAQKVLTGASCLEAIGAINASMADGPDKTFGEFQLVFGNLPTDGSTVDVSVKMGGVALGTGPLGTLAAVKCTDPDSGSNRPAATGPSSLNGFSQITQTGQCTSAGTGTSGVVAKYPQGNCSHASTEDMIAIAEQAFGELLASLGSPFNSLEDVGYWRYLDGGTGTKSLIWTGTDISGITTLQRVPFIQAQQDAQGNMTYYVGLVSAKGINGQGAIMVQDGQSGTNGAVWNEMNISYSGDINYIKNTSGEVIGGKYVVQGESGYVYSDTQQGYSNYQDALAIYNQLSGQMTDDMKYRHIADGTPALL